MIGLTRFTATGCGGAGQRSTGIRDPSVCHASGVQSRRGRSKAPHVRILSLALDYSSACRGSSSSMPAPSAPPASPSVTAPPAPVDPYGAKLNLGFEDLVDGYPALWASGVGGGNSGIVGYEVGLDHVAHGGATSLRFHAAGDGKFASSAVSTDAAPLRGKRVRLHGWVKTDGVGAPGYAGVWLRA